MAGPLNIFTDVSALALTVQEDAIFVVREMYTMAQLVTTYNDRTGLNTRTGHQYNQGTVQTVTDADDLTSHAFTPSTDQVLTPAEIGLQFFISDARAESDIPENILTDAATELGLAAADKLQTDILGDLPSLTGGTIGAAGTAITFGYLAAAISRARVANKSNVVPLAAVVHEYQWSVLARTASVAGATIAAVAPNFQEEITRTGFVAQFMGVPIYQVFGGLSGTDFTGGVFPRIALALDWRRNIRVRPERDESRRGLELNMSAIYAHGVWRPARGVKMTFDASAPSS